MLCNTLNKRVAVYENVQTENSEILQYFDTLIFIKNAYAVITLKSSKNAELVVETNNSTQLYDFTFRSKSLPNINRNYIFIYNDITYRVNSISPNFKFPDRIVITCEAVFR